MYTLRNEIITLNNRFDVPKNFTAQSIIPLVFWTHFPPDDGKRSEERR